MLRKACLLLTMLAMGMLIVGDATSDADKDAAAIRQAVLNYVNAAYDVRPELVEESVNPKLQKVGYISRDGKEYREAFMTYDQLKELVSKWNTDGHYDTKTARRDIKVLDQLDRIAVARLDAEWGVDFFHLSKVDGKWKIMNVIWQTYPAE
jgi:hypothetical protein